MTPQFSDGQVLQAAALNQGFDDLMKGIGKWDASGNTFPSTGSGSNPVGAILFGNFWFISVAGTLGTQAVNVGDMIVAAVDNPGQIQSNWSFYPKPIGYVPQQQNAALTQISTAGVATANTFWAMASTGALALKSITDAALSFLASWSGFTPYRANISGAVSINLATTAKSNTLILTLTGNVSSFALTNPVDGACYNIWLLQDATGGRTFAGLDTAFKFGGGAGTTSFVTTPNARNLISATYGATEGVYLAGFTPGLS